MTAYKKLHFWKKEQIGIKLKLDKLKNLNRKMFKTTKMTWN